MAAPATPGLLKQSSAPQTRPSAPRRQSMTERPPRIQRPSLLGVRQRRTRAPPKAYNTSMWNSDSSSSSDDDNVPNKPLEKSDSEPLKAGRKPRRKQRAGKKPSDDPYSRFAVGNDSYNTSGHVSKHDGRLNIRVQEMANKGYLANALGATFKRHVKSEEHNEAEEAATPLRLDERAPRPEAARMQTALSSLSATLNISDASQVPKLNIVIMVIGSRGDIQPFLRLGKVLKEQHGHRIRIATHPAFKEFVEKDSQLEFFSVGGDPAELMAFMVKNPGLIPKAETIRAGEIAKRRDAMYEMFQGFWRACINAKDDETDDDNLKMMGKRDPFVADAIIANPPSFAHIHCAERLGIPLHLMFTFPTSPTQQFPHPLTNIKQSNVDTNYINFISYPLVEMMTWQGLGDLVNRFRVKSLGLEPISTLWAPGQVWRLRVPHSYLWSPALIPKPADWGPEIDITGFVFLDLASSFKPADDLVEFLGAGPPPVYIGFGSIVVDDPDKFTALIFEAVKISGVRALVSKGWGGLGDENNTPDNIYMLGNTPHDWLFPRVSAVVHHGGAGSTAIGLKCGKPTMIVPFFGDQPFWGAMVAKAGAGADPVPYKQLTAEKLAESIKQLLTPEVQEAAKEVARKIEEEGDGAVNAVKSFHTSLPLKGNHSMCCSILEDRVAVWWLKGNLVRLSSLAAEILVRQRKIRWEDLRLVRHYEWNDFEGPGEPLTGSGAAIVGSFGTAVKGVGRTPFRWAKTIKRKEEQDEKRKSAATEREAKENKHTRNKSSSAYGGHTKGCNEKQYEADSGKAADDSKTNRHASLPSNDLGKAQMEKASFNHAEPESPSIPNLAHVAEYDASILSDATEGDGDGDADGDETLAQNLATETGAGLAKTGGAIAKAPMDLSLALARGFHNAPRLYGDTTVRKPIRINGMKSGLRAAGREFAYGIYDGWTGLVKQPYQGAKQDGAVGFAKGVGKGVGGWVLKDFAALCGLPAYTLKGLHREMIKGRQPTRFIRRSRTVYGQNDYAELSDAERKRIEELVDKAWQTICAIQEELQTALDEGLKGRIAVYKNKRIWKKHGAFETVRKSKRALDAQKEGRDLDVEFPHPQVRDTAKAQRRQEEEQEEPRGPPVGRAKTT